MPAGCLVFNIRFTALEQIQKDDKEGIKPLFRDRNWNKEERIQSKVNNKLNWYNNPNRKKVPRPPHKRSQ